MIDEFGLTEVPRTERSTSYHDRWNFDKGDVRKAFQKVFSPEKEYVLFQTTANPKAVEELKNYVGFREGFSPDWEVRKSTEGDVTMHPRKLRESERRRLYFDNSLMDSYQAAVDKITNKQVGQKNFSHYPMVATSGVHNAERDPNAIFWPTVYIVTDEKQDNLKKIIDDLGNDKSIEVLRKIEEPTYYQTAKIETLHELGIPPLIRLEHELKVGAKDLALYIDFLSQMTETYRWTGSVIDAD